jgi:hypothetical protein
MHTQKNVIIHDYNLEKIKHKPWFESIQNLPTLYRNGRRDGYYNSWKAFITKEVYDEMKEDDILYYVDSSQYFINGFTENIDKLCDIVNETLCIAGSVGDNVKNTTIECCHDMLVWNKIITGKDNTCHLLKLHVLNSWFLFKKCPYNHSFINEWAYFSCYTDKDVLFPMVTYHHTADQSIFNILVVKHNLPVFYDKNTRHEDNKNKNIVLQIMNNAVNPLDYLIYL